MIPNLNPDLVMCLGKPSGLYLKLQDLWLGIMTCCLNPFAGKLIFFQYKCSIFINTHLETLFFTPGGNFVKNMGLKEDSQNIQVIFSFLTNIVVAKHW